MSRHYGQSITWGPLSAPRLFAGEIISYSYSPKVTKQNIAGGGSNFIAMALHSKQAELMFEAKITSDSTNFLLLSDDASAIAVDGINTGIILVSKAVEKWQLGQAKTGSIEGIHFPDIVQADPVMADNTLSAFTPDQSALAILYPGNGLIYGTLGMTHAAGVLHGVTLTQTLVITPDDPSPAGAILGAATHSYERTLSLEILAKAEPPALGSELVLTGGPDHSVGYRVISTPRKYEMEKGMMYTFEAAWIPAFEV